MASGEIARQITQFLIGVALARLLTPADYGLIAMAMFVVGFVGVFGRTGMAEALVQRPVVSAPAWSSVYWLGLAIGCCVGLSVWVLAPFASSFFRDDRIVPLIRALG